MTYQPLFEMTQDVLSWIGRRKTALVKREFQHFFRCWTGEKALKELQEANISALSFPTLQECARKAIKAASEAEPDVAYLSGMAAITLEGLFSSLNYFFSGNGVHACDYELALRRFVKKNEGGWTTTFSLWCMNPAVVFKSIAELSQSVILTSGTLSPLNTFSSELGVQFGTSLEAPHVIDIDSQVWAAAIANGPGNYPLNASYKTANEYAFQDSVGTALEEICQAVPGGCLVFFPSYKLLDKVSTRWQETGQWSRLNAQKSLFVEPRGSSQDSFEAVLKSYYDSIRKGTRQVSGRKARGKKLGLKSGSMVEATRDTEKEGAAFLAVCRGKVSEGMDFSDDNARAVVIVGIPFPNIYDIKVSQKKKFNDTYELSKNLLSGNEWYCQQAFRALNQATGRCIRHRFDYGAIIFLDERFHKDRNRASISKWLRNSIRLYSSFEESLDDLRLFFRDVKARFAVRANPSQDLDVHCENLKSVDKNGTRKKNNKVTKFSRSQHKVDSNDNLVGEKAAELTHPAVPLAKYDSPPTQTRTEVVRLTEDKDPSLRREYIDLECDSEKDLRWAATPLAEMSSEDIELTIVKETPATNYRSPITTTESFSKDECSSPRTNHQLTVRPQHSSFQPRSVLSLHASPSCATPEKGITSEENSIEPEADSCWSANSYVWKRRKINGLSSAGHLHELNTPLQVPDRLSSLASSITTADATHRTEDTYHSENGCGKFKASLSSTLNNSDGSHVPSGVNMDEKLKIHCSRCKNPIGLPENDLSVMCSRISTSKIHLISLHKRILETDALSTPSVEVLVMDTSSVNHGLCETCREGASGQGIWCKEDGCVFNSVFCPFCAEPENCLGVHIVATDSLNIKFQNKILLYVDCLEMKDSEASKDEALSARCDSSMAKDAGLTPIEKFAYVSPVQDSGGWRNPKSRMRLPKKG